MYRIILNNTAIALPLGWMLSRHTADTIDRLVNFPYKIDIEGSRMNEAIKQSLHDNVKVNANTFRAIEASLTGKCSEAAASLP